MRVGPYETNQCYFGDALELSKELPDESIHCIVTGPPYWGLRDYGVEGQLGLEKTPEEYVDKLVAILRDLRRALRADGTLWLNLGDCYGSANNRNDGHRQVSDGCDTHRDHTLQFNHGTYRKIPGLKPKDLVGIPWRVAFALQADGWYLRSDIIWAKPNPMPESVTDRPTKSHEYVFLLAKSGRYYYDVDSIREPCVTADRIGPRRSYKPGCAGSFRMEGGHEAISGPQAGLPLNEKGRNKRSVWTIPLWSFPDDHFAVAPPDLFKPCVLAGCPEGGVVLDPFMGSGTTGMIAQDLGRRWIGFELQEEYKRLISNRTSQLYLFGPSS